MLSIDLDINEYLNIFGQDAQAYLIAFHLHTSLRFPSIEKKPFSSGELKEKDKNGVFSFSFKIMLCHCLTGDWNNCCKNGLQTV
jgi:hypothetical protein